MSQYKTPEEIQTDWNVYLDAWLAFLDKIEEASAASFEYSPFQMPSLWSEVSKTAENMIRHLVRLAEIEFAPVGSKLEIPLQESGMLEAAEELYRPDNDRKRIEKARKLDFVAAWNKLKSEYGGERGEELAYRQAADVIANSFYSAFRRGEPIKQRRGRFILDIDLSVDTGHDGRRKLSFYAQDSIRNLHQALKTFAVWAGDPHTPAMLEHQLMRWWYKEDDIRSRERIYISDNLDIVTYFSRFEYQFSPELGRKLQTFMGLYAPKLREVA